MQNYIKPSFKMIDNTDMPKAQLANDPNYCMKKYHSCQLEFEQTGVCIHEYHYCLFMYAITHG